MTGTIGSDFQDIGVIKIVSEQFGKICGNSKNFRRFKAIGVITNTIEAFDAIRSGFKHCDFGLLELIWSDSEQLKLRESMEHFGKT